jgi:nucleoside-diphosphate-sugar epimerase
MNKILVTGAAGYIGSVLTRQLLSKGYSVIAYDSLLFGGESLISVYNNPNLNFVKGDIRDRDKIESVVKESDAVLHLAAIVGDPACAKQPDLAKEVNWKSTKQLFDLSCSYANVKRFIFASTCSNYGKVENDEFVNEDSPLNPVSLYAELKVKFEKYLLESTTRDDFIVTSLRFATVYGISPRMRFDLTVNEFIREVAFEKELQIFGEQFWRPYTHVEDLARSCVMVLEASTEKVNHNVFGVGDTSENYQKKVIAEEILKIVPSANIKYVQKNEDPRDYRVDFSKIRNELGFSVVNTLPQCISAIYMFLKSGLLSDPYSQVYRNI